MDTGDLFDFITRVLKDNPSEEDFERQVFIYLALHVSPFVYEEGLRARKRALSSKPAAGQGRTFRIPRRIMSLLVEATRRDVLPELPYGEGAPRNYEEAMIFLLGDDWRNVTIGWWGSQKNADHLDIRYMFLREIPRAVDLLQFALSGKHPDGRIPSRETMANVRRIPVDRWEYVIRLGKAISRLPNPSGPDRDTAELILDQYPVD